MTHEGLDAALAAAAGEGSGLRMVAFSHLDLSEWREGHNYILPQDRPAPGQLCLCSQGDPAACRAAVSCRLVAGSAFPPLSGMSGQCLDGL